MTDTTKVHDITDLPKKPRTKTQKIAFGSAIAIGVAVTGLLIVDALDRLKGNKETETPDNKS